MRLGRHSRKSYAVTGASKLRVQRARATRAPLTPALALQQSTMTTPKPYEQRTDLERIESQWRKLSGLRSREEWSAAIVRAATAAEIASNLAIRKEFSVRSQLDAKFVDSLLRWANGLSGKINRLLLPLFDGRKEQASIRKLTGVAEKISDLRNDIVHRGTFCNQEEAREVIRHAKTFVEMLVRVYEPGFALKEKKG